MANQWWLTYSTWIKIASILFVAVSIVAYAMNKARANFELTDAQKELAQSDLQFMSWDGVWQGTDCDTIVEFSPSGKVKITYFSDDHQYILGTYKAVGSTIIIDAQWEEMYTRSSAAEEFPQLLLRRNMGALYLFPASATGMARYSNQYGWPFRQSRGKVANSSREKH